MLLVRYRPRADTDIESAAIFIGEVSGNPNAAKRFYDSIGDAVDRLSAMPHLGKPFADSSLNLKNYRVWNVGNYQIFYSHDDEYLTIWRVIHYRQDIDIYAFVDLPD